MNPADVAQAAPIVHDFSLWSLFWQAHFVVKLVMLGLLAASVWCWADHRRQDAALRPHQARHGPLRGGVLVRPVAGGALPDAVRAARPPASPPIFVAAMREWKRSFEGSGRPFAEPRRSASTRCSTSPSSARSSGSNARLMVLASIGSAGPYIGLFGTVVGIMNSFTSIAASKNTSLAVVAPGIAEALFATAIGLFAAIPAVLAYNKLQAEVAQAAVAPRGLRRRVLGHPVAPDRRAHRRCAA